MADTSLTAQISDLLGENPYTPVSIRCSVADALAACGPGQVVPAQEDGQDVAVVVLRNGRAFVLEDRCPHDGGALSDGYIEGDKVVCARHGWEIDPCTGQCPRRARAPSIAARAVAGA